MPTTPTTTLTPGAVSDWSDIADLQRRMIESVKEMEKLVPEVGMANHITQYDSDRRKRALARAMQAALAADESVAKAEAEARASELYSKELAQLGLEHKMAEQTIAAWQVEKIKWETARSLLALERESAKI